MTGEHPTSATPAKIDVAKLRSIQKYSQRLAFLVLFVFVALIIFSVRQLSLINAEIGASQARLKETEQTIAENKAEIKRLEDDLASKKAQIKQVAQTVKSNPQVAEIIPRVSFEIRDESQRPKAQEIANYLQLQRYLVTDIENVGPEEKGYTQEQTEVRYFRLTKEGDQNEAKRILAILRDKFGIINSRISLIAPEKAGPTIPRQFEIWFKSNPL